MLGVLGLDLVCGDAVRLGCFIWFGLIVGQGFVVVLIWVGWVEVGGFLVCCLVQFLRVVAFVVSFVGLFAVDLFWLLLLRFTVICCVNSVVMRFFIVLRLWLVCWI